MHLSLAQQIGRRPQLQTLGRAIHGNAAVCQHVAVIGHDWRRKRQADDRLPADGMAEKKCRFAYSTKRHFHWQARLMHAYWLSILVLPAATGSRKPVSTTLRRKPGKTLLFTDADVSTTGVLPCCG